MPQPNNLDDLSCVPVDHEVARVRDASHPRTCVSAARSQMDRAHPTPEIITVLRAGQLRIAGDASDGKSRDPSYYPFSG